MSSGALDPDEPGGPLVRHSDDSGGPLIRHSLSNQVSERLTSMILESDLSPGDLLPASGQLAATFEVSIPVIREALKSLEGEGLIRVVKGRGSVILDIDRDFLDRYFARAVRFQSWTLLELLGVRRALESEAAALAAVHGTPEQIESLCEITASMAAATDDPARYAELDVEFHVTVAEASRNHMLLMLIMSVRSALKESVLAGLGRRDTSDRMAEVQRVHDAVADAVARRDPEAAAACMRDHFDSAVTAIVSGEEM